MRTLFPSALLLALAAGAGCNSTVEDVPNTAAEVSEARYSGIDAAMNERKGKVILVDIWATWCGPCIKTFPDLVAKHKKYADKGLVCMSISLDKVSPRGPYSKDEVLQFLRKKGATFPNFVLSDPADLEKIAERFAHEDSLPHQALFGRDGKRVWEGHPQELRDKLIEAELAK